MNYIEKLKSTTEYCRNLACMGLDPVPGCLPGKASARGITDFFEQLFGAMKKKQLIPGAFKPNLGFYHCLDRPRRGDFSGSRALASVLDMLDTLFPEIPVILDYKRGDIARSSENYASEGFQVWACNAVTAAPYMGSDSVIPFLKEAATHGGGTYVLNRTSNKSAAEFQNLTIAGKPLYMHVAEKIAGWAADYPGTGAVVSAISPKELEHLGQFYASAKIPLLIPGVGGQGGKAEDVISILKKVSCPMKLVRINSSSGITHPWGKEKKPAPTDWLERCISALKQFIDETAI